nr:RNA-directed DNA polymerase, eukaryota [Tanacetum cinerariifolium]
MGDLVEWEDLAEKSLFCKRLCVKTKANDIIVGRFKVIVKGSVHWVHAKEMKACDPFICNDSYESESCDDEEDAEDDRSQSRDKVIADNDVEMVSESTCMHNNDLLYDYNHNNIMPDKDKVLSDDPFNLYDILNKRKDSSDDLKYPPGFTPSVINVEKVNKKEKWATSNEVNEHVYSTSNNRVCLKRAHTGGSILQLMDDMELVTINTLRGSSSFEYPLGSSLGNSGGGSNEEILSDRSLWLKELNDINSIDSLEADQKSKVRWAIKGDENAKFFRMTLVNGEWIIDPLVLKSVFLKYFSTQFSSPVSPRICFADQFTNRLSLEQQDDLECNIFNEEIKSALWECGTNKSLGPDGFTFEFFRRYWKLLEHDIVAVVKEFFA